MGLPILCFPNKFWFTQFWSYQSLVSPIFVFPNCEFPSFANHRFTQSFSNPVLVYTTLTFPRLVLPNLVFRNYGFPVIVIHNLHFSQSWVFPVQSSPILGFPVLNFPAALLQFSRLSMYFPSRMILCRECHTEMFLNDYSPTCPPDFPFSLHVSNDRRIQGHTDLSGISCTSWTSQLIASPPEQTISNLFNLINKLINLCDLLILFN